jgi:hypothetical protein
VKGSIDAARYKIGYLVNHSADGSLGTEFASDGSKIAAGAGLVMDPSSDGKPTVHSFGSLWLDAARSDGNWKWHGAQYIKGSEYRRSQVEPPGGLITEDAADAEKGNVLYLTRNLLSRAGRNRIAP